MKTLDPAYRCECGLVGERCDAPDLSAPDEELRRFYQVHPLRKGLFQSVRSRRYDALLSQEAAARRTGRR